MTLYHGDCLDILPTLAPGSIDAVITDPPYRLTSGGHTAMRGIMRQLRFVEGAGDTGAIGMTGGIFNDKAAQSGLFFEVPEFDAWMPLVYRALRPDADAYVMTNARNMHAVLTAMDSAGFGFHNILVWDKGGGTANKWYMQRCEFIIYAWKGRARVINNPSMSNLLRVDPRRGGREHPTEKPPALMRALVEQSTNPGAVVLDPFMGSGTTGVACAQTGRAFVGIEKDASYFAIAERRIAEAQMQTRMAL